MGYVSHRRLAAGLVVGVAQEDAVQQVYAARLREGDPEAEVLDPLQGLCVLQVRQQAEQRGLGPRAFLDSQWYPRKMWLGKLFRGNPPRSLVLDSKRLSKNRCVLNLRQSLGWTPPPL